MTQLLAPEPTAKLTSCRVELDSAPHSLGALRDSNDVLQDDAALRARMAEDGYLFLPGFLDRRAVLEARREVTRRLFDLGVLHPEFDPMDAVPSPTPDANNAPHNEATRNNEPLRKLLYGPRMLGFYERLLGGAVRHYDFTWFRAMHPGSGTKPHCDLVYMGRGTSNLFTAWVPIGDLPREVGGLMVLENSHRQAEKLEPYLRRDVDAYCVNRPDASQIEAGEKLWQDWDGTLTKNPASLREKLGGRWLTAEFRASDLLTFGMATVHGSIDNRSDRLRLSSDSRYQLASDPVDERWVGENPVGHGVAGKRGRVC